MTNIARLTTALILADGGRRGGAVRRARRESVGRDPVEPDAVGAVEGELRAAAQRAAAARPARSRTKTGATVRLGDYFGQRPVVLAFVYYDCPMLCTQVLNGLDTSLSVLDRDRRARVRRGGRELRSARDAGRWRAARRRRRSIATSAPESEAGWHFLTGEEPSIKALTDAAGFHYVWDDKTQQFAHPSGIIVVDAGWPAGALLLRHRVRVARREVRADRVVGRPHRQRDRSAAALLLSLRPGDRVVRVRGDERRCGSPAR